MRWMLLKGKHLESEGQRTDNFQHPFRALISAKLYVGKSGCISQARALHHRLQLSGIFPVPPNTSVTLFFAM